jgi:hypothetical protein
MELTKSSNISAKIAAQPHATVSLKSIWENERDVKLFIHRGTGTVHTYAHTYMGNRLRNLGFEVEPTQT